MKIDPKERSRRRSITLYHAAREGRIPVSYAITEIEEILQVGKYPDNEMTHKEAIERLRGLTPDKIGRKK